MGNIDEAYETDGDMAEAVRHLDQKGIIGAGEAGDNVVITME